MAGEEIPRRPGGQPQTVPAPGADLPGQQTGHQADHQPVARPVAEAAEIAERQAGAGEGAGRDVGRNQRRRNGGDPQRLGDGLGGQAFGMVIDKHVGPDVLGDGPHLVELAPVHALGGAPGPHLAGKGPQGLLHLRRLDHLSDVVGQWRGRQPLRFDHVLKALPGGQRHIMAAGLQDGAQRRIGLHVTARAQGENEDAHATGIEALAPSVEPRQQYRRCYGV